MSTLVSKTTWWNLPEDPEGIVPLIKKFVRERKGTWDRILCLGIGGSALGIVTIQKALFPFDKRLTVVDNLDSITLDHLTKNLNPKRTLVLVISKSGETLETQVLFEIFRKKYSKKEYQKNFIAITDPEQGKLREIVRRDDLSSFPIPHEVGGRFSVLSAVGLLPLALLGGNIDQLLKGAREMKKLPLAKQLATLVFNSKKPIIALMVYSDHLAHVGSWYQQLVAESLGKSRKIGITPLPLRGASDQHSVLQLLQDGPNNIFTIFVDIIGQHKILRMGCKATEQALREDGRPTALIEVAGISELTLGRLFMLFEMQVVLLAERYGINAFNQPGVEKSKKIMKNLLKYI